MGAKKVVTFHSVKEGDATKALTIYDDGTASKTTLKSFGRSSVEAVDLTGATLTPEDDGSGWRTQRHVISLTIRYAEGHEEYHSTTLKGIVARGVWRDLELAVSRHNSHS